MRLSCRLAAVLVVVLASSVAAAQVPDLPQPSPHARVEQRVGVTDVSVDYSSPAVKGRTIWGALVPFEQPWRTGANAATKLVVTNDFVFGGKQLPAGTYSLFTVPGKAQWSVMLNSNANMPPLAYDAKTEVARVTVKPEVLPTSRERLAYLFSDTTEDATNLDIEWEKLRVRIPLTVNTKANVAANIDHSLADAWKPHWASARYLLDSGGDLDKALAWIDTSINIHPHWWNKLVKAQILAKKGQKKEALALAEEAMKLGQGDAQFESFGKGMVSSSIAEWKK